MLIAGFVVVPDIVDVVAAVVVCLLVTVLVNRLRVWS